MIIMFEQSDQASKTYTFFLPNSWTRFDLLEIFVNQELYSLENDAGKVNKRFVDQIRKSEVN